MHQDYQIVHSKHVTFDESKVYGDYVGSKATLNIPLKITHDQICDCCSPSDDAQPTSDKILNLPSDEENMDTDHESVHELDDRLESKTTVLVPKYDPPLTRQRSLKSKENDDDYNIVSIQEIVEDSECALITDEKSNLFEPKTYKQAISCTENKLWQQAINDEFNSLIQNKTWVVVPNNEVPKDASVVTCRWLFRKQIKPKGIRNKARVIAQGFKNTTKYSKFDLYAPVSCIMDIRLIIQFANQRDLDLCHLDIKTAFLNAPLQHYIYMKMVPGLPQYLNKPANY